MKFKTYLPALALVALTTSGACDENYSNINLGPTFFTFKGKEKSDATTSEQKGLYCGVRAEVEYTVPDSTYAGFIGVYAPGAQTAYHTFTDLQTDSSMKASSYLWQVEGRFGRHIQLAKNTSFVPFLAVGMYHVDSTIKVKTPLSDTTDASEQVMEWGYIALGGSGSYPVSDILDVGFGVKLLRHVYCSCENTLNGDTTDMKPDAKWGYEIMLPLKMRAGKDSPWNFQAEPFFLKIDTDKAVNVMGARISVQRAF